MSNFDVDQEVLSDHLAQQRKILIEFDNIYGELSMIPARAAFWKLAKIYYLDEGSFLDWAATKEWNDFDKDGMHINWLRRFRRRLSYR